MKKILALLLIMLTLALTACGGTNPTSSGSEKEPESNRPASSAPVDSILSDSKKAGGYAPGERTIELFGKKLCQDAHPVRMKFRMEIEMEEGMRETVDITFASNTDGTSAADFTSPTAGHIGTLGKDKENYTILHDQRIIMMQDMSTIEIPGGIGTQDAAYYTEKASFTAGTEEINGKTYDYDEMTDENGKNIRVYFEAGTDKWAYMRSDDAIIEVLGYGNDPDPAMFALPSDYSIMDASYPMAGSQSGGLEIPEGVTLPEGFTMP